MTNINRHFINQLGDLLTLKVKLRLSNIVMHLPSLFSVFLKTHMKVVPSKIRKPCTYSTQCPVKGCMKTFLRSSTLQHYVIIDEHVIQSKKETIYERAKQGQAKRLEEGFHANPALQTKFELLQGESNEKYEWAPKSCKSRSPFKDHEKGQK